MLLSINGIFFRAMDSRATKAREWKSQVNSMPDWFLMATA